MKEHVLRNSAYPDERVAVYTRDGTVHQGRVCENDGQVIVIDDGSELIVMDGEDVSAVRRSRGTMTHCPTCNEESVMVWYATKPYECGRCDTKVEPPGGPSSVFLTQVKSWYEGTGKIAAIKFVRENKRDAWGKPLGLREAKELVETHANEGGWRTPRAHL